MTEGSAQHEELLKGGSTGKLATTALSEPSPLPEAPPSPPPGLFSSLPALTRLSPPLLSKHHHSLLLLKSHIGVPENSIMLTREMGFGSLLSDKTLSPLGMLQAEILVTLLLSCSLCSQLLPGISSPLPRSCCPRVSFPSWASRYWIPPSSRVPVCDPHPFCLSAPSWKGHCFLCPGSLASLHPPRP